LPPPPPSPPPPLERLEKPICAVEAGYDYVLQFEDDRSKQDAPTSRDAVAAGVRSASYPNFF
jgi:hypothetical protein